MTARIRSVFALFLCLVAFAAFSLTALRAASFEVETVSLDVERMNRYLAAEAGRLQREAWERIDSPEKLEAERQRLLEEFRFMIGLDPLPPRTPLEVTLVRTVERKEYFIEVLHYQSLPGFYVTANLYRPRGKKGPLPAVIWGPGHSRDAYGGKAGRQRHAALWAMNGYI